MIGVGIGCFFRMMMLVPVTAVSCALIVAGCLLTATDAWLILLVCVISLQLGYVAGSSLITFLRQSPRT